VLRPTLVRVTLHCNQSQQSYGVPASQGSSQHTIGQLWAEGGKHDGSVIPGVIHPQRVTWQVASDVTCPQASLLHRRIASAAEWRPVSMSAGYIDPPPAELVRAPRKQVSQSDLGGSQSDIPGQSAGVASGRSVMATASGGQYMEGRICQGQQNRRLW
jgi:hypothetical protein